MTWANLASEAPELAATGEQRLNGRVSYLATTRANGSPRVHPVTPIIGDGSLFVFMEPTSPKGRDLERGGRFALHCGVEDNEGGGGEFSCSGTARRMDDEASRTRASQHATYAIADRYILFELLLDEAVGKRYAEDGAVWSRWRPSPETRSQQPGTMIAE